MRPLMRGRLATCGPPEKSGAVRSVAVIRIDCVRRQVSRAASRALVGKRNSLAEQRMLPVCDRDLRPYPIRNGGHSERFGDQVMTFAAIDRLVHPPRHILEMNVESYPRHALDRNRGAGQLPAHTATNCRVATIKATIKACE